jgi:hypothetical protein
MYFASFNIFIFGANSSQTTWFVGILSFQDEDPPYARSSRLPPRNAADLFAELATTKPMTSTLPSGDKDNFWDTAGSGRVDLKVFFFLPFETRGLYKQ